MKADNTDTLSLLAAARRLLHDQLSKIELADKLTDNAINSISLIVRTLEKIDQLSKSLLKDQVEAEEERLQEDYDELKTKVETLIQQAIDRERASS